MRIFRSHFEISPSELFSKLEFVERELDIRPGRKKNFVYKK